MHCLTFSTGFHLDSDHLSLSRFLFFLNSIEWHQLSQIQTYPLPVRYFWPLLSINCQLLQSNFLNHSRINHLKQVIGTTSDIHYFFPIFLKNSDLIQCCLTSCYPFNKHSKTWLDKDCIQSKSLIILAYTNTNSVKIVPLMEFFIY